MFNCKFDESSDTVEPHGVLIWLRLGWMKLYGAIDRLSGKWTKS